MGAQRAFPAALSVCQPTLIVMGKVLGIVYRTLASS
jgi:hypothetical protein